MKKFSLILLLCFSAFLIEPTAAYLKGERAASDKHERRDNSAPSDARKRKPAGGSSAQTGAVDSDANTAAPAREMKVKDLPAASSVSLGTGEEDEDEPLSDIDPQTLQQMKRSGGPRKGALESLLTSAAANEDPAVSGAKGVISPLAPTLLSNFAGVSNIDQTDGFIHKPPDTNLAVGPSNIVVVVNNLIGIYSKAGGLPSKSSLKDWFANLNLPTCGTCTIYDPRVAYEPAESKWIIIALFKDSTSQSKVLVSISQTSNPSGSWWIYGLSGVLNFNSEDTWADYPDVGFDGIPSASNGAIYITVNQFTFSGRQFRTALIFIIKKSELYAGGSVNYWRTWDRHNGDGTQAFTFRASKTYGNPGGEFLVNTKNNGSIVSLWRINPTYPPTPVDMTLQSTINIGAYALPPNATQPGTPDLIDTMDNRIFNAVWQNNRVYGAFNEAHDWGSGNVSAFRYLKINTLSNTAEINDFFGADGFHYFCPAIAPDSSDNIVVVFSRSSGPQNEFAGARYSGRLTTDTGLQSSASLKPGTAPIPNSSGETSSRWGDYQGAAIDPADGSKVWIYGEYTVDLPGMSNDFDWGTWIGQVQFSGGVQPTQIQFSTSSYGPVNENVSPGLFNVTVSRSGGTGSASSVSYATSNGTAKEGKDYVAAVGVIDFAAGETSKTFPVLIINNAFVDASRTVNLTLSNAVGGTLAAPSTATLTINNDDGSLGANPLDTPRSFVQLDYYDFLGRYPDTAGWDFWTNQILNCSGNAQCVEVTRVNVSASFFLSIEFQQTGYLVERFYKVAYGNATGNSTLGGNHTLPVPIVRFNEFLQDTQRIGRGVVVLQPGWEAVLEANKVAYSQEFVQTTRFTTAFPTTMTPTQFVDQLNTRAGNVLSAPERTTAINLFGGAGNTTNTTARARALRQVAEDADLNAAESNRAFVLAEYFGYLRRNPNDAPEASLDYTGFEFWLNKLNQFSGNYNNAEMVKAFLSSIEYRQRFGP